MNPIRRISMCVVFAALAAMPLAQVADAKTEAPEVPADIQVGAGHKVLLSGHAVGVQIYRCNAVSGGFAWGLVAPRANLYDDHGKLIVTHYGGPTWEARDGSTVVAARDGQATVDPTAIPWLRLRATSASPGPDGDRLVKTAFIQRVATTGGLAPAAADCSAATAGEQVEVPYTADYHFWKETGR
jgi:Protein of unknown function (DUF3455)